MDFPARRSRGNSEYVVVLATVILIGLLAGFTALQYMMPLDFTSQRGLSKQSVVLFTQQLGTTLQPLPLATYTALFRSVIILAVLVHGGLSLYSRQVKGIGKSCLFGIIVAANLCIAVLFPASLSSDIYNYSATAHLFAYYHLNPYVHSPLELHRVHDTVADYIGKGFSSVYGPIWTYASALLVIVFRNSGLFSQVLAYKILEAVSLIATSWIAKLYCGRIRPEYGTAAMVAVGLNPLLLVEGPGNGHNDFIMMAFFLLAMLYWKKSIWKFGLFMGLAVGIKVVPLALILWLALDRPNRHREFSAASRILCLCLILAPTILLMPPFWAGGHAVNAFFTRINLGNTLVQEHHVGVNSQQIVTTASTSNPFRALHSQIWLVVYFVSITLLLATKAQIALKRAVMFVIRRYVGRVSVPAWTLCWIFFVCFAEFFGRGYWFSWYYSWAIIPAACCWSRRGNIVLPICMAVALADTINYSIP